MARPEPVRNAATVAASLTAVVGLVLTVLVVGHVLTPDDSAILGPAIATATPTVIGAVAPVVAALRARLKVTPVSDPRDAAGRPLIGQGQQPGVADHAAPEGEPQPLPGEIPPV